MPTTLFQHLFRRLHGLAGSSPLTDEALLADYVARRDQKAFELLVWRHGAMVLHTCQRIVRCPAEAEDASQAVFWILARKAGTIRRRAALPGWLHRIAVRVALAAKQRRGKHTSFANLLQLAFLGELWIRRFKLTERVRRTECHKAGF